jgi:Tol biopolymer transport system component
LKKINTFCLPFFAAAIVVASCNSVSEKKENHPPLIEMKSFFKNGNKTSFQISPDGKYYAFRADFKGKMNIFVRKLDDTSAVRVTSDTLRNIDQYTWKGQHIIYLQDAGGDENFQLFSVSPDGKTSKALTPFLMGLNLFPAKRT